MKKSILFLAASVLLSSSVFAETKCFIAKEKDHVIKLEGDCKARHSPCSTFKAAISVMGFDSGVLVDETHPMWPYQPGYVDWISTWKQPINPTTWMKYSVVWYSQEITTKLGMDKFKNYLSKFNYGNQDVTGSHDKSLTGSFEASGLTNSWLGSTLKISGEEQTAFLQKLVDAKLPVSPKSQEMTKKIMYLEELKGGWKLYGKTGSNSETVNADGSINKDVQMGWFVGWIEKGNRKIVFAHYIEQKSKEYLGIRAKVMAREKLLDIIKSL